MQHTIKYMPTDYRHVLPSNQQFILRGEGRGEEEGREREVETRKRREICTE